MLYVKNYLYRNNYKFFSNLVINCEKRKDKTKRLLTNTIGVFARISERLLIYRLAKFEFRSICSSFLFFASRSRNKVKRAGLTRTITPW